MEDRQDTSDKPHDPTQKRLDDARRKGEIARSTDLSTAANYASILVAALLIGGSGIQATASLMSRLMSQDLGKSHSGFVPAGGDDTIGLVAAIIVQLLPWFLVPMLGGILIVIAQKGFVFTPEKLKLKLNRISPLATARNKFGRSGLFEFAKSFVKLLLYSAILGVFLWRELPEMMRLMSSEASLIPPLIFRLGMNFLTLVFLISASIGVLDFFWQRHEHLRKNRMSHKEMTDEVKQNEGDPHMKSQRRQKGYEIAMNQMLAEVPTADVVLVNPTHYAVALKWSRSDGTAPVCVAKGKDEIAARIREIAAEAGVPIHRDPQATRAIFSSVDIGQEVRPVHYEAVAAAIRFAEHMRQRAKAYQARGQ